MILLVEGTLLQSFSCGANFNIFHGEYVTVCLVTFFLMEGGKLAALSKGLQLSIGVNVETIQGNQKTKCARSYCIDPWKWVSFLNLPKTWEGKKKININSIWLIGIYEKKVKLRLG